MSTIDLGISPIITKPDDWRLRARCRGVTSDDFFPHRERSLAVRNAKWICGHCPLDVRLACLQLALDTRDEVGIYGGLTADERREVFPTAFEGRRPNGSTGRREAAA